MSIIIILFQTLSSSVLFASRPFLTGWVIAVVARGLDELLIRSTETAALFGTDQAATSAALTLANFAGDSWLISDVALMIFTVMALLELLAHWLQEIRLPYESAKGFFASGSTLVVTFGLVDGQTVELLDMLAAAVPALLATVVPLLGADTVAAAQEAGGLMSWVGHGASLAWAGLVAAAAWLVAGLRGALVELLIDADEDDSLGVQAGLMWLENFWVTAGVLFLVVFPILAMALFGLTTLGLFLLRRHFEAREQKSYIPCAGCGAQLHPSAPFCPACRAPNAQPRQVGLFGQARDTPVSDPALHRAQLIGRKRCPTCATRLSERSVQQACGACGSVTFADISQVNTFLRTLDRKLPATMAVCFAFGLVPLVGLVPGIAYYRLSLVASLRGYIPRSVGCFARWGVRLLNLALIAFQPIPVFGAFLLPVMCAVNYAVYRQVVYQGAAGKLGRTFDPPAAAPAPGGVAALPAPAGAPLGAAPAATAGRFCPSCGAHMSAGYRFCTHCGSPTEGLNP